MQIKYKQHIPAFCEGFKPVEKTFNSLKKLLEYILSEYGIPNGYIFAYGEDDYLMISSIEKRSWWVLGYVEGIDLKNYLPHFERCYKRKPKGEN